MPMTRRINTAIDAAIKKAQGTPGTTPARLAAALDYATSPGGARVRPTILLSVAKACGDDAPKITDAACAIGACGPVATRLPEVEAALRGAPATPGSIAQITDADLAAHIAPIDDMRADAAYRSESAGELLRRCLTAALDATTKSAAA